MTFGISFRPLKRLCFFLVVVVTALVTQGELPPSVYQELQKKSPEALTIKVEWVGVSTTNEATLKRLEVTAEARVEMVNRSSSGLKPGATIRIHYVRLDHKRPLPGPSEPEILRKGLTYPAFLVKAEKDEVYSTAAGGYSFRTAN